MSERPIGFRASVANLNQFLASINKINQSYAKLGKEQDKLAQKAMQAGNRVLASIKKQEGAETRLEKSKKSLQNALDREVQAYLRLEIAQEKYGESTERIAQLQLELAEISKDIAVREAEKATIDLATATKKLAEAKEEVLKAEEEANQATKDSVAGAEGAVSAFFGLVTVSPQVVAAFYAIKTVISAALGVVEAIGKAFLKLADILLSVVVGAFDTVLGVIKGAIGILDKLTSPLRNFIGRVAEIASGILLASAIRSFTNEIRDAFSGMVDTLSEIQRRIIQLSALTARDFSKAFGVTMAEAFSRTSDYAEELFDWVVKLSLKSPFSVQAQLDMLAMANSFGINIKLSKELTDAVTNFASGMGLGSEQMERIIYNFGQMIAIGKLTGREFRDLSTSFVPIEAILQEMADEAEMTKDEFRKLALTGGVPVIEFVEKFIEISERDFPGAAEKMARTFQGVVERIKSFIQVVVGRELFGPVFDRLTGLAADVLDKLLSPEIRQKASEIGDAMLMAFNKVYQAFQRISTDIKFKEAMGELAEAFGLPDLSAQSLIRTLGTLSGTLVGLIDLSREFVTRNASQWAAQFQQIAANAKVWGQNIITQLANGMAAASALIVKVINAIGRLISGFLKTSSPPKLLPHLVEWGIEAMEEYLKGWGLADFKIFGDIAGEIESYLRAIPSQILDEKNLVPTIVKMRLAVTKAVEEMRKFGDISQNAIDNIKASVRGLPEVFYKYIRALLDYQRITQLVADAQDRLASAQERVKKIQEEINEVNDRYSKILDSLNAQLREATEVYDEQQRLKKIDAALATNLLTDEERARLEAEKRAILLRKQIREVEAQRDAELDSLDVKLSSAEAEEKRAEQHLENLQKEQEAIQEQIDTYKEMINVLTDNQSLLSEYLDLLESMAKAVSDLGSAVEGVADTVTGVFETWTGNLQDLVDRAKEFGIIPDEEWGDLGEDLTTEGIFGKAFEEARQNVETFLSDVTQAFENTFGEGGTIGNIISAFSNLFAQIFGGGEMSSEEKRMRRAKGLGIPEDQVSVLDRIIAKYDELRETIRLLKEDLEPLEEPSKRINENLEKIATNMYIAIANFTGGGETEGGKGGFLSTAWDILIEMDKILLWILEKITSMGIGFTNWIKLMSIGLDEIRTFVGNIVGSIEESRMFQGFETWIENMRIGVDAILGFVNDIIEAAGNIGDFFANLFGGGGEETELTGQQKKGRAAKGLPVTSEWDRTLDEIRTKLTNFFNEVFLIGGETLGEYLFGWASGDFSIFTQIGSKVAEWLTAKSDPKYLPGLTSWGTEAMNEYLLGWEEADFATAFANIGTKIAEASKGWLDPLLEQFDDMSVVFAEKSTVIGEAIASSVPTWVEPIKEAISEVVVIVSEEWKNIGEGAAEKFEEVKNIIIGAIGSWLQPMLAKLSEIVSTFNAKWSEVRENTNTIFGEIREDIESALEEWWSTITDAVEGIKDDVYDLWEEMYKDTSYWFKKIGEEIETRSGEWGTILEKKLQAILKWWNAFWPQFLEKVAFVFGEQGVIKWIRYLLDTAGPIFRELKTAYVDPLVRSLERLLKFQKPSWWPDWVPWPFDYTEPGGSLQTGGATKRNRPYLVGEKGMELFVPSTSGYVVPNNVLNMAMRALASVMQAPTMAAPMMAGGYGAPSRQYFVEVNPTYTQVASPAHIYHDVSAALAAVSV